jgi:hypothetical protein
MRIVEVLIALVLVFTSSLLITNAYSILPPPVSYQRLELTREGYNILTKLDQRESLSYLIYFGTNSSNWSLMVESLSVEFAQNIYFNVTIFDSNNRVVNQVPISNTQNFQATFHIARFSASILYFVAGYSAQNTQMTQFYVKNYVLQLIIVKVT